MPTPHYQTAPATPKPRKLDKSESLAMLQGTQLGRSSDAAPPSDGSRDAPGESLSIRLTVQRARLVLLTAATIALVAALTWIFSGSGVVIETFNRKDVSTKEQEQLLERYNSYSGSVTAAVERPVELFAALVVQVVVLRLMAVDVLHDAKRWRVRAAVVALGAAATYLLANGLSAVNVQVKEQKVELIITADDLSVQAPDLNKTSSMEKTYSENRPGNPVTNTILRNLILPRTTQDRQVCSDADSMDTLDEVVYRMPQRPWMQYLIPAAPAPQNMQITISKSNAAVNEALTPEQFPMNVSAAADLLVYSMYETGGVGNGLYRTDRAVEPHTPAARRTNFLPPKYISEREDREWFLKNSGPTVFNLSTDGFKNASLRSWTMTFSRVDIEPGSVWVEAVTFEREVASPRLQFNTTKDGKTWYFPAGYFGPTDPLGFVGIPRASKNGTTNLEDTVSIYGACVDSKGNDELAFDGQGYVPECDNTSTNSLMTVSYGRRLVADTFVENATSQEFNGLQREDGAVVLNLREIYSTTVARLRWTLQDLSTIHSARCDVPSGCMGLSAALPESRQRLVVSASAIPVTAVSPFIAHGTSNRRPFQIVSAQHPQFFNRYRMQDGSAAIGDVLLPHNIRNMSTTVHIINDTCVSQSKNRLISYVDNHVYIENTLQTAYTASTFFLFKSGVAHDVLNQSTPAQTMLAFDGNVQNVDVYVYIPSLNVMLTFGGCVLLVVVIVIVLLWPQIGLRGTSDPLQHITEPHTIANIMLNESAFPPMLVKRAVAQSNDPTHTTDNADEFAIQQLSLQHKEDQHHGTNDKNFGKVNDDPMDQGGTTVRIDP